MENLILKQKKEEEEVTIHFSKPLRDQWPTGKQSFWWADTSEEVAGVLVGLFLSRTKVGPEYCLDCTSCCVLRQSLRECKRISTREGSKHVSHLPGGTMGHRSNFLVCLKMCYLSWPGSLMVSFNRHLLLSYLPIPVHKGYTLSRLGEVIFLLAITWKDGRNQGCPWK